jgi:hypothetical protein
MEETKDSYSKLRLADANLRIENERADEVNLFYCLPEDVTSGTAYDYYAQFPGFDEEVYYLLEVTTRENADANEVVSQCANIVEERNKQMLDSFGGKEIFECELSLETDLNYDECPNLLKLSVCNENIERDSEH